MERRSDGDSSGGRRWEEGTGPGTAPTVNEPIDRAERASGRPAMNRGREMRRLQGQRQVSRGYDSWVHGVSYRGTRMVLQH